jgi:hypothetical protein
MLSSTILRTASRFGGMATTKTAAAAIVQSSPQRFLATSSKSVADALVYSGYSEIDFTIPEGATVYEAVQKLAAFNIGCLVTVDAAGT